MRADIDDKIEQIWNNVDLVNESVSEYCFNGNDEHEKEYKMALYTVSQGSVFDMFNLCQDAVRWHAQELVNK